VEYTKTILTFTNNRHNGSGHKRHVVPVLYTEQTHISFLLLGIPLGTLWNRMVRTTPRAMQLDANFTTGGNRPAMLV
jgi:hypothetical protein